MGAVIVGTSEHVVSAPMAAYLVRNQSRFKWSVNFKYIPVREVVNVITDSSWIETCKMSILDHNNGCFFTSEALHYLCRPKSRFQDYCLVDFFQEYETIRTDSPSEVDEADGTFEIDDTDHPGFQKQKIRRRTTPVIAQFSHWLFPDAASFGGNIMEMSQYPVNASVENFCRTVLVLYHPFRNLQDITIDGSFHKKFKSVYGQRGVPVHIREILANVQMFYNSMRMPARDDPLESGTEPFESANSKDQWAEDSEEEDDDNFFDGIFDVLACQREQEPNRTNDGGIKVSLRNIRKAGGRGCGFYDLPCIKEKAFPTTRHHSLPSTFVSTLGGNANGHKGKPLKTKESTTRDKPSPFQLMALTYRRTKRRIQEESDTESGPESNDVCADGTALSIIQWSQQKSLNLDEEQQLAFQIVTAAFILTYYQDAEGVDPSVFRDDPNCNNPSQVRRDFNQEKKKLRELSRLRPDTPLLMFLDGAGGSGKSRVVTEVLKYAEEYTSKLNLKFDMRTIIVTALSGVAAVSIGGETLHSAAALNRKVQADDTSWANARLLIIDEVSFMSAKEVETLDEKLRTLRHKYNSLFGGIHILFCGDFRQLEPITGNPLYSPLYTDKKWVNSINCYVELLGLHRFKDDPKWGQILSRIRNDSYNQHDIDAINENVVKGTGHVQQEIPGDASYCVYTNADRTAINAGIFSNLLNSHWKRSSTQPDHMLVVKGGDMVRMKKSGKKYALGEQDKQYIYENCGDHRVRAKISGRIGHFVDPMLKLYYHIPLMLVSNDDVPNGHANGTRVLLEAVVFKEDVSPGTIQIDGSRCPSVDARDVDHFLCSMEGQPDKHFRIEAKKLVCCVRAPIPKDIGGSVKATINFTVSMKQFPLIANNATTGHKLQGQTKKNLVVSVWSKKRNWNYVALSRVQTREGLYLIQPLPYNTDFSMSHELRQMLDALRQKYPAPIEWDLEAEENLLEMRRRGVAYASHRNQE